MKRSILVVDDDAFIREQVDVTLTQAGSLRGCIGSLEAHRPLGEDVAGNALSAAFRDPRFQPLSVDELTRTRIEVSLLEAAQPFAFSDEADALARLRPGVDGLILHYGQRRATFLPQVWESLPKPRQFLQQLFLATYFLTRNNNLNGIKSAILALHTA